MSHGGAGWNDPQAEDDLPPGEREKLRGLRSEDVRRHFLHARSMLRRLLARYLGVPPDRVRLESTAQGKPHIDARQNAADMRFNLSHSGDLAACAVARHIELGVDIQRAHGLSPAARDSVALRCFSAAERAYLRERAPEQRARWFYAIWAAKEAIVKAEGSGLRRSLRGFSVVDEGGVRAQLTLPASGRRWHLALFAAGPATTGAIAADCPINATFGRAPGAGDGG
jgi:4'-phosphopantetheinyl transferase